MEESFDLIAQTRANYYTPGSPVQFVRVELLRGNQSGDNAVCLTFKNISQVTLTALDIVFKCKNAAGEVLCEDSFEYRNLQVHPGEMFGMDDAVFMSQEPVGSVDVILKNVYSAQRVVRLENAKRVRLPAPRRLSEEMQTALCEHMSRQGLRYAPQMLDNGWYCACGAFHPKEEDTFYCSECGCDRILLQNALNNLMQPQERPADAPAQAEPQTQVVQPEQPAQAAEPDPEPEQEEPTRVVGPSRPDTEPEAAAGGTRTFIPPQHAQAEDDEDENTLAAPEQDKEEKTRYCPVAPMQESDEEPEPTVLPLVEEAPDEDEEEEERDVLSENIIRWVPPVAALLCAGIALSGFVYCRFLL